MSKVGTAKFLNVITNLVLIIIKGHYYTFLTFPVPFEFNSPHVVRTNLKLIGNSELKEKTRCNGNTLEFINTSCSKRDIFVSTMNWIGELSSGIVRVITSH